jgi:ABC-type multidrug transport system ATPase subunit
VYNLEYTNGGCTSERCLVEVEGLVKVFNGEVRALDGLSLAVAPGRVYGLLGPNGAGKTTLIRVLATLLVPDAGSARVAGIDVRHHPEQVRARIGLAGQSAAVDEHLTGRRTSSWSAACMGCPATRPAAAAARSWSGSA